MKLKITANLSSMRELFGKTNTGLELMVYPNESSCTLFEAFEEDASFEIEYESEFFPENYLPKPNVPSQISPCNI